MKSRGWRSIAERYKAIAADWEKMYWAEKTSRLSYQRRWADLMVGSKNVEGEAGGLADYDGQSSHISASPSAPDVSREAATGNGADAIGGDPGAEPSWLVGSTSLDPFVGQYERVFVGADPRLIRRPR